MDTWKVIYVSSRAEKKVALKLTQQGIEAYVPIKRELRQWSDRKKTVDFPMISGYVFVKPSALQRDKVLQVPGALQYVRYNGTDAVIRDIEIAALKSIEEKGYFIEGHFGTSIAVGDRASIQAGPFKGMTGTVSSDGKKQTYAIVIPSIDYSLTLHVPLEVLKKEDTL